MTELTDFQRKITDLLPNIELRLLEPLSKHTSFRIGGCVEVMAFPKNKEELSNILKQSILLDCTNCILGSSNKTKEE